MLQSIRDHTHGWIAGIIISLLIISFALWGIHSYFSGGGATTVVATVNGVEISKTQLATTYDRLRRQLQMQFSSNYGLPPGAEAELKNRALEALVQLQVLRQASIKQNYRISDRQIDAFLQSMPDFQVDGRFSFSRFQQILSTTLFNAGDFLELIRTDLLIAQPRLGLLLTSFALPDEVKTTVALVNQQRDIAYTILPVPTDNTSLVIPAEKINAYYQSHQAEFKTLEQVSVEYIELSVKDLLRALHASQEELKSFYNENSNAFIDPMQWQLEAIFLPVKKTATDKEILDIQNKIADITQKIKNGESFTSLAREYPPDSTLPKLKEWVTLNQLPADLRKPVTELTKVGQIGNPIKLTNGMVLLKVQAVKEAHIKSFEAVKEKVEELWKRQKAEEKFVELRDKLANSSYEHPDSLQPAAETLGEKIKVTNLFTKEKGGKDISANIKIREAAFSHDVLSLQNNSDLIQLSPDSAIVIRIKSHVPTTLLSVKVVEDQIRAKLKSQEINQQTAQLADRITTELSQGTSMDQVAQKFHFTWDKIGFITRQFAKVDSTIISEAFSMPLPSTNPKKVINYTHIKTPQGYAVIALLGVKEGTVSSNSEEYELFEEQVQNSQGLLEYKLYQDSLIQQAKIVVGNQ